jgi:hypothetical protein
MWLAVSGACASAVRLFLSDSPLFIANAGIAPHIALGASLVCIAAVVHFVIPKLRGFLSQAMPLVTCASALASFSFGVLILQRSMLDGSSKANTPIAKESRSQDATPSGKPLDASKEVAVKNLATAP